MSNRQNMKTPVQNKKYYFAVKNSENHSNSTFNQFPYLKLDDSMPLTTRKSHYNSLYSSWSHLCKIKLSVVVVFFLSSGWVRQIKFLTNNLRNYLICWLLLLNTMILKVYLAFKQEYSGWLLWFWFGKLSTYIFGAAGNGVNLLAVL